MRVGINLSGQCHVMPVPAWCLAKAACVTLPGHWMPGSVRFGCDPDPAKSAYKIVTSHLKQSVIHHGVMEH